MHIYAGTVNAPLFDPNRTKNMGLRVEHDDLLTVKQGNLRVCLDENNIKKTTIHMCKTDV